MNNQDAVMGRYLKGYQPETKEQVRSLVARALGLSSVYQNFALGLDGAHYWKVDWDIISKFVDFVIWKGSEGTNYKDETTTDACQAAYDRKTPFGIYHFFRADSYLDLPFPSSQEVIDKYWPRWDEDPQVLNFISVLKNRKFNIAAIDIEDNKELVSRKPIDPLWLSMTAKIFCGRIQDWLWKTYQDTIAPLAIYTSNGYIGSYAPDMANWAGNYAEWVAQWYLGGGSVPITWEQLKSSYMPADTVKPRPWGTGTVSLWQFICNRFIVPGVYTNPTGAPRVADLNVYMGSRDAFRAWCHYGATPPDDGGGGDDTTDPALVARLEKAETQIKELQAFRDNIKAA